MNASRVLKDARHLGYFICLVSSLCCLWFLLSGQVELAVFAGPLAFGFAILSLVNPALLVPVAVSLVLLGELLGRVINPIVWRVVYWVCFVPFGLAQKAIGRDVLRLRGRCYKSESNWVKADDSIGDRFDNMF